MSITPFTDTFKTIFALLIALTIAACDKGTASSTAGVATPASVASGSQPVSKEAVRVENAKKGTTAWQLANPATDGEIEGYASATSVNRGGSLDLFVSTGASAYRIDLYRMGYYGGAGARLMTSFTNLRGQRQLVPCLNPDNVIECNWFVSQRLTIPDAVSDPASGDYWASGVYLAKLTTDDGSGKDSYIIFVVRDDARAATYVAQLPVTTYQAYNYWGGKSLYTGCKNHDKKWGCSDGAKLADAVSFNRPYVASTNPAAAYGVGAGEFITNVQPVLEGYKITSAGFDYNMVRWMEKEGYDVKYVTNLDLHENNALLRQAKAFLSTGHDEYYSKSMWDNLVDATEAGINLAFFSSNQIYWQVRFSDGAYGTNRKNRIMNGYRNGGDPVKDNDRTTGKFRYLGRAEAALIGNQYIIDEVLGDISITNPGHWMFSGTGATDNTVLKGLLGYEINAVVVPPPGWCWRCLVEAVTRYKWYSPANTKVLAHSTFNGFPSHMTYYVAPSSAQIFATGSMQWSWGLDDFISNRVRENYTNPIAQRITANVFDAIGEKNLVTFSSVATARELSIPLAETGPAPVMQIEKSAARGKSNQWRLLPTADGDYYRVISRASGLCLDAGEGRDETTATTADCNGGEQQKWLLSNQGNGHLVLMDKQSGHCLGASDGNGLTVSACRADNNQQWVRAAA
jgi:hypothetical protein